MYSASVWFSGFSAQGCEFVFAMANNTNKDNLPVDARRYVSKEPPEETYKASNLIR